MTDFVEPFPKLLQLLRNEPNLLWRDDEHHTDTQIEGPAKVLFRNAAEALEKFKDLLLGPGSRIYFGGAALGQHTGNIIGQASARDMSSALQEIGLVERLNRREIGSVYFEEFVGETLGNDREVVSGQESSRSCGVPGTEGPEGDPRVQ